MYKIKLNNFSKACVCGNVLRFDYTCQERHCACGKTVTLKPSVISFLNRRAMKRRIIQQQTGVSV